MADVSQKLLTPARGRTENGLPNGQQMGASSIPDALLESLSIQVGAKPQPVVPGVEADALARAPSQEKV